jgi:hypothetical protein
VVFGARLSQLLREDLVLSLQERGPDGHLQAHPEKRQQGARVDQSF